MSGNENQKRENSGAKLPGPDDRVEIFIPRGERGGDPNFYVSVNLYSALLPRGQTSLVPRFAAEEIRRAMKAENDFWAYSESRELRE